MTPPMAADGRIAHELPPGGLELDGLQQAGAHLTSDQFGELVVRSGPSAIDAADASVVLAEAHLLGCEQCAAELAGLRQSLTLFREATSAYSENEVRRLPRFVVPARPSLEPAYWVAAAAMFLAAFMPLQVLREHAVRQASPAVASSVPDRFAESDEALLADVDREVSASVPTTMQALADPTGDDASTGVQAPEPAQTPDLTSDQGKD